MSKPDPKSPPNQAYFAPPTTDGADQPDTAPVWGEDAADIARTAGLGSYGAATDEQESREDRLIATLERNRAEIAGLSLGQTLLWGVILILVISNVALWVTK